MGTNREREKFMFIQMLIQNSSKKKEGKEIGPQVARANPLGPDVQMLKDKIGNKIRKMVMGRGKPANWPLF